ncbi:MAG: cache domain-containing protein, partial [Chloroflexota bacterium]|nr:cache domain-containing protein [Chloroflexota bacterium]
MSVERTQLDLPPARRRGSIRRTLLIYSLLLVLLPSLSFAVIGVLMGYSSRLQSTGELLETTVDIKQLETDRWVDERETDLFVLAEDPTLRQVFQTMLASPLQSQERRAAYSQVAVQLSRFLSRKGAFVEFSLLEAQTGQTVVSTALEREGESHVEQAYFLQGLKGAYLQSPAFDPAVNAPTILISRPVFGSAGEVLAVLLGRANLSDLNALLQAGAELGETYLVSANGLYVAGSLKPEDTPTGVIYSFAIREALDGGAGVEQYVDFQGQEVMGAYRYLPKLNVALLIEVDQATVTAAARRQAYVMLIVVSVAAALGIVAALLLTRRVVSPIIELTEAATEIAEGDLLRMAPVQRTDEIGTLAQAFNSMTAQLRDLIGSLEQRVAERTADLTRRSAELEASAQVAREAAAIRDVKQLLDATVRLISEQFGFYHAGIFLLDDAKTYATLAAASSEGGQRMLARGHRLEVGQVGIVGYV